MIAATFISVSQFSVEGDLTESFRPGQPIALYMGTDGNLETYTTVVLFDSDNSLTLISTESSAITENLTEVRRGHTFVDRTNQQSNLAKHQHTAAWDGDEMPAAGLTDAATVTRLNSIAGVGVGLEHTLVGVNKTGDGFSKFEVAGVTHRTSVTFNTDDDLLTISGPQDIDTVSSPTFEGVTLSGLAGVLLGNSSSPLTAIAPSATNEILRSTSSGFEFITLDLNAISKVNVTGATHLQTLRYHADVDEWLPTNADGTITGGPGPITMGLILALISAMK